MDIRKEKCDFHEDKQAQKRCACGKRMCDYCSSLQTSCCPHCHLKKVNPEYKETARLISKAANERSVFLLCLMISITCLILMIFLPEMRPFYYAYIIFAGLPLIPFTAPQAFRNIKNTVRKTEGKLTQVLFAYLLIVLYVIFIVALGMPANGVYICLRTLNIKLYKVKNQVILDEYMHSAGNSEPKYISV